MGTFVFMNLRTYLKSEKLTYREFAEKIGVSEFAVGKWARGERIPRARDQLQKIATVTDGKVSAVDFYEAA